MPFDPDAYLKEKSASPAPEERPGGFGAPTDVVMRGPVATTLGAPVDMAATALGGVQAAIGAPYIAATGKPPPAALDPDKLRGPVGGSDWFQKHMEKLGLVSSTRRPMAEGAATLASMALPFGVTGAAKAGSLAKSLRSPKPIADVAPMADVGERGFSLLQGKSAGLHKARADEAEKLYNSAFDVARQKQAGGEPFATSAAGRKLLAELEHDKSVTAGGREFSVGEEKAKGIDRLVDALRATEEAPGKPIPLGSGRVSSAIVGRAPASKPGKEKDIKAVVEELRFLRDVDAKGKPYAAYEGLSADYKRDLIKRLEGALYEWSPEYKTADEAYRAASRKLDPFRTEKMAGALKGERFNPRDLVASPEKFGPVFFSDVDGVRQLKAVTGDDAQVAKLGKEYAAAHMSGMTPKAVRDWAFNPNNTGWLQEAGIKSDVQRYAKQAKTAADRQQIALYLAAGTGLLSTISGYGTSIVNKLMH